MRLPGLISQSFVPRLVRICTTLVENRPYSAANGLASISTDSRLWPGSSRSKSPDDGIDEAGAADLQRTLRGLAALGAKPPIGTADDAGQQRQQALEIVAFERRDVEDRSRQHVAGRHRLHALGWRRRRPHLDARRDEHQLHVQEHLRERRARTSNGADSVGRNPGRVASTI